jgi:hypothetical protein
LTLSLHPPQAFCDLSLYEDKSNEDISTDFDLKQQAPRDKAREDQDKTDKVA